MTVTHEIQQLATNIHLAHNALTLEIACTAHLAQSLMRQFASSNNTDLSRMTDMLRSMTNSYAREQGIQPAAVQSALSQIRQASHTVAELDRIDRIN